MPASMLLIWSFTSRVRFRQQWRRCAIGSASHRRPSTTGAGPKERSEEHTSELQSLLRTSYAVFCLEKNNRHKYDTQIGQQDITNQDNNTPCSMYTQLIDT